MSEEFRFVVARPAMAGGPVVQPGTLPTVLLEQEEQWVNPHGYAESIPHLTSDQCEFYIDHLLANARSIRQTWATETQQSYDEHERSRRWMLKRPVMRAMMRRYLEALEAEEKVRVERAFEENPPE